MKLHQLIITVVLVAVCSCGSENEKPQASTEVRTQFQIATPGTYTLPSLYQDIEDGDAVLDVCRLGANADDLLIGTIASVSPLLTETDCDPSTHRYAAPRHTVEIQTDERLETVVVLDRGAPHRELTPGKRVAMSVRAARGEKFGLGYVFLGLGGTDVSNARYYPKLALPAIADLRTHVLSAAEHCAPRPRLSQDRFEQYFFTAREDGCASANNNETEVLDDAWDDREHR